MKKIAIFILIVLVIGAYLVKSYNNLDLKDSDDFKSFIKIYFGWVYDLITNLNEVTGYATQKDWLPKNNSDNSSSD